MRELKAEKVRDMTVDEIENRIRLHHDGGPDWARVFERFGDTIAAETLAVDVRAGRVDGLDGVAEGGGLWIGLKRA